MALRFKAMVAGAMGFFSDARMDIKNVWEFVFLGISGTIFRRETLPLLHGVNTIVMRCPLCMCVCVCVLTFPPGREGRFQY
jgi:hypothetical protein